MSTEIKDKPVVVPAFAFVMPLFDAVSLDEFIPCSSRQSVGFWVWDWNHATQRWKKCRGGPCGDGWFEDEEEALAFAEKRHLELCAKMGVSA